MTPLQAAYASAADRMAISFEDFERAMARFKCVPVEINGELAGSVLVDGPVIHACILPEKFGRWVRKGQMREVLGAIIEKHGFAITSANTEAGDRFVRRFGFEPHQEINGVTYYRMTAETWEKRWALKPQ